MTACERYARWLRFWYIKSGAPTVVSQTAVRLMPPPGLCAADVLGVTFPLDPTDLLQANILLDGIWSPELTRWWLALARPAEVVFDVGAHIGYFSMLAHHHSGAHVHAFEPNPRMRAQFEQAVVINNYTDITVTPAAITDARGRITLYIRERFEPGASSTRAEAVHDHAIEVPTMTLDDYCDQQRIERVDLLKMDIEGAEVLALRGMLRGFEAGRYGVLVMDVHNAILDASAVATISETLRRANFHLYAVGAGSLTPINGPLPDETVAIHTSRLADFTTQPEQPIPLPGEVASLFER